MKIKNVLVSLNFLALIAISAAFGYFYTKNQNEIKILQDQKNTQVRLLDQKVKDFDLRKFVQKFEKSAAFVELANKLQKNDKIKETFKELESEIIKTLSSDILFFANVKQDLIKIVEETDWNIVFKKLFLETLKGI